MRVLRELLDHPDNLISQETFDRAEKMAELALASLGKGDQRGTGTFRQVSGGLKGIAVGGVSKLKAPTAKLQVEANKKLDEVIKAVETAGREPVLIRFV